MKIESEIFEVDIDLSNYSGTWFELGFHETNECRIILFFKKSTGKVTLQKQEFLEDPTYQIILEIARIMKLIETQYSPSSPANSAAHADPDTI